MTNISGTESSNMVRNDERKLLKINTDFSSWKCNASIKTAPPHGTLQFTSLPLPYGLPHLHWTCPVVLTVNLNVLCMHYDDWCVTISMTELLSRRAMNLIDLSQVQRQNC